MAERLFAFSRTFGKTGQELISQFKLLEKISKFKANGRSDSLVRVTYTGLGDVEKISISKDLEGNNKKIAEHLKLAINDGRQKIHEEKLREWNTYMKEQEEQDEYFKMFEESFLREFDPLYNPDETSFSPEIFEDDKIKYYQGLKKQTDLEKFMKKKQVQNFILEMLSKGEESPTYQKMVENIANISNQLKGKELGKTQEEMLNEC
eukprot:gene2693-3889_t